MHPLEVLCRRDEAWLVALIRELVACESPSDDRASLDLCQASWIARHLMSAGATVERIAGAPTADHVLGRWPGGGPPVLLLGHYDTVWRVGQLEKMRLREEGGKLFGPGVFDMKAGLGDWPPGRSRTH